VNAGEFFHRKRRMRILIADGNDASRLALEAVLAKQGHEVVVTTNGDDAWKTLLVEDRPRMAILDWIMPGVTGVEICRRVRSAPELKSLYLLLLASPENKKNLLSGLGAGANDYVNKPFDFDELEARVFVGAQMVQLQSQLEERAAELQDALSRVKQLQGLLPICSYCKSIRDDQDYWHRVEHYIGSRSEAQFSHGICPECWKKVVEPELQKMGLPVQDKSD
jgi:phosphoserine phosphatase RsbU/P